MHMVDVFYYMLKIVSLIKTGLKIILSICSVNLKVKILLFLNLKTVIKLFNLHNL